MAEEREPMPVLGVGPVYVSAITLATVAVLVMDWMGVIPSYSPLPGAVTTVLALVMIAAGVAVWYMAVIRDSIAGKIKEDVLMTEGVYAYVRNPIYSAITLVNWGLLVWSGNLWLLVLIPAYWFLLTVMMVQTEEKWLYDRYGEEFTDYCSRVNRCIPWFPKKP